jgi:acyl-coenzyme A thioesterase PaaI-like protein
MAESRAPDRHPAVTGREPELGSLSKGLRRLVQLAVTTTVPPEVLGEVASGLEALADRLEAGLPEVPFPRFMGRDPSVPADAKDVERAMPFDVVVGRYNPLALPVRLEIDPPRALGRAVFTTPYEGAPGCVHGASIAGAFDIVLTVANMIAGAAGPTVRLALRFRRPTLLGTEALFEAWVDKRTERRIHTSGRLVQNGQVTVEAEGEFATLDMEEIASLHRR